MNKEAIEWLESQPINIAFRPDIINSTLPRELMPRELPEDVPDQRAYGVIHNRLYSVKQDHCREDLKCPRCGPNPLVVDGPIEEHRARALVDTDLAVDILAKELRRDRQATRRWLYGQARMGKIKNYGGRRRGQARWDWRELEPLIASA